ncbi:MAG: DUF4230 domain-containing protein [Bacteroidota bacterium]
MMGLMYAIIALIVTIVLAAVFFTAILPNMMPDIPDLPDLEPEEIVQVHTIIVEEISGMGKMELVKYKFSDIVKHQVKIDYWPDPEVRLQAFGETVACIDFTKIDSSDIFVQGDSIYITLPNPEICYSKIDHERSEIVNTQYTSIYSEGNKVIQQTFLIAEQKLMESAMTYGIMDSARSKAQTVLRPILRNIAQKQVFLQFPPPPIQIAPTLEDQNKPTIPSSIRTG